MCASRIGVVSREREAGGGDKSDVSAVSDVGDFIPAPRRRRCRSRVAQFLLDSIMIVNQGRENFKENRKISEVQSQDCGCIGTSADLKRWYDVQIGGSRMIAFGRVRFGHVNGQPLWETPTTYPKQEPLLNL